MSYLALYRKYRPSNFEEIVGQEAVVKALRNQVKNNQIGHAYLFCGTHGTGKTTVARVFAKAVNCLSPVDGNPCGHCEFCQSASASLDIIEIDAASNTGVDNIRDLREEVVYAPVAGRFKIYIIDEAHMLSTAAFNALLKTLEEPPEHVIFILATTEPQKILTTILSRCQRYDFGRLTQNQIFGQLKTICEKESMAVEEEALSYMASHVDGSSRDALSLLDQCRAYFMDETITLEKVLDVLGAVDSSVLTAMTDALATGNAVSLLQAVDKVFGLGRDPLQLVSSLASYLRGVLMYRVMGAGADAYVSDGPAARKAMEEQANRITNAQLTFFIQELSRLNNSVRYSSDRRVLLETGLVAIAAGRAAQGTDAGLSAKIDQLEAKIAALNEKIASGGFVQSAPPQPSQPASVRAEAPAPAFTAPQTKSAPKAEEKPAAPVAPAMQAAPSSSASGNGSDWDALKNRFADQNVQYSVMKSCVLEQGDEPDILVLRGNDFSLKMASGTGNAYLHGLEAFVEKNTGKKVTIVTGPPKPAAPGKSMQELLGSMGSGIEWK